jgi:hypothetical protein
MNIGNIPLIQKWMNDALDGVNNFKINTDFSIDLFLSLIIQERSDLFPNGKLPEYIRFKSSKSFDVDDCGIVSLEGFPLLVAGYFSCQMNKITSLEGFPIKIDGNAYVMNNSKKFTMQEIKQKCNVFGDVEADDSDDENS